jgi:hypothetical protein
MTAPLQTKTTCRIEYRCLKRLAKGLFTHAGVRCGMPAFPRIYAFAVAATCPKSANEKPAFQLPNRRQTGSKPPTGRQSSQLTINRDSAQNGLNRGFDRYALISTVGRPGGEQSWKSRKLSLIRSSSLPIHWLRVAS